jgi:hypothetical protein
MGATSVSHGVINIDIKASRAPVAAVLQAEVSSALTTHPITTSAAPEPVVQHSTVTQNEAAAMQPKTETANAAPAA